MNNAARSQRFNDTTGASGWTSKRGIEPGSTHPDRCVCQGDDQTPHKHYDKPPYSCARCGHRKCSAYKAAVSDSDPPTPRVEVEVREEDRVEALMFLGMVGAKITDYNKGCAARVIANTRQNALASARQAYEVEREAYATELMLDLNRIASGNYRALYQRHQPFFDALQAAEAERQKLVEEYERLQELLWRLYEGLYGHRSAPDIDPFSTAVVGALLTHEAWEKERPRLNALLRTERTAREAAERERDSTKLRYGMERAITTSALDCAVDERNAALARVAELETRTMSFSEKSQDGGPLSDAEVACCRKFLEVNTPNGRLSRLDEERLLLTVDDLHAKLRELEADNARLLQLARHLYRPLPDDAQWRRCARFFPDSGQQCGLPADDPVHALSPPEPKP